MIILASNFEDKWPMGPVYLIRKKTNEWSCSLLSLINIQGMTVL